MAKNGFGGDDFLYIGLGVGAIYAIYKLSNSVVKTTDAAGQVSGNVADLTKHTTDAASSWIDLLNLQKDYKAISEWLANFNKNTGGSGNNGETPVPNFTPVTGGFNTKSIYVNPPVNIKPNTPVQTYVKLIDNTIKNTPTNINSNLKGISVPNQKQSIKIGSLYF